MTEFNWCHGPECHKQHTVDRVRGVKGSKVLRTKKVPYYGRDVHDWINNFCSQNCLMEFVRKHCREMIALEPRTEPLETPIEVSKVKHPENTTEYGWTQRAWTETKIEVRQS